MRERRGDGVGADLCRHDLGNAFRVIVDSLVGGSKQIFRDGGALRPLCLLDGEVTATGAILATSAAANS